MLIRTDLSAQSWTFQQAGANRWLPASIPGCVHLDLRRNDLIPDPFWGSNEKELQWIEQADWSYRCAFDVSEASLHHDNVDLVLEGVDTVATIRLNGKEIAATENMFRTYRLEVKPLLRPKANLLEIDFANPMDYIRARKVPDHYPEWNDPVGGSSVIRKEQCSFGWDWGPRFATSGLTGSALLEAWSASRIKSVRIIQEHHEGKVALDVQTSVAGKGGGVIRGAVTLKGKLVASIEDGRALITKPQLWWPHGYGPQPLYEIALELGRSGEVVDTWTSRIGLRTIALDRHPDVYGETFQFVVNGRPIFAKGANWIPAHSFITEVAREDYDDLLSSATAAHMNMIRVWGGGIYETEDFYDLCDEKGLLLWQDFMFACAQYPGDAAFLKSVEAEATDQVRRLANRACLALWCGNNEIEQMPAEIVKTKKRKKAYDTVFNQILPAVVARYDGITAYWPCSPHNPQGYEKGFNSEKGGDAHFWDVWHARFPVSRYEETRFRFCSEFGMQSYSSPEIAATFCDPEHFNVFGAAMENHQKNPAGNSIIMEYISRRYGFPKDYTSLAYLSQLNQAYCMKVGVEHFRRSMPRTMGALYWQLNDCWPCFSWSSLEFGGKWKALHHAARRFFAPLLISAKLQGTETIGRGNELTSTIDTVDLYTVSDVAKSVSATVEWTLFHLDGRTLLQRKNRVTLHYAESTLHETIDLATAIKIHGRRNIYLRIRLHTKDGVASEDTVFLIPPRLMDLPRENIVTEISSIDETSFAVLCRSHGFHHQTQIDFGPLAATIEENFFELYPNEPKVLKITTKGKIAISKLRAALTIRSLADSY